jgi:hypothetical protein
MWHPPGMLREHGRPGATFPGRIFGSNGKGLGRVESRARRPQFRYRPEDRCNGCFRYSSDVRYKRQSLPPYTQRSSQTWEQMEILPRWRHNRYKPQSLTPAASSWRKFAGWRGCDGRHTPQSRPNIAIFTVLAAAISRRRVFAVKIKVCPGRSTVTAGKVCATGAV